MKINRLYGKARKQERRFSAALYWAERLALKVKRGLSREQVAEARRQFITTYNRLTPSQRELIRSMGLPLDARQEIRNLSEHREAA